MLIDLDKELKVFHRTSSSFQNSRLTFFFPRGRKREHLGSAAPFFFPCEAPNMFHIASLNGVDSGNAVTLLCLPNFQSEVWPVVLVALWTGADWATGAVEVVRLSHVGFLSPLEPRCPCPWFCLVMFLFLQRRSVSCAHQSLSFWPPSHFFLLPLSRYCLTA